MKTNQLGDEIVNKIMEMNLSEISNSIQSGKLKVCVIGIGRIGLPKYIELYEK